MQAGGGVYLERRADRDLLEHCRAGDFSYILTSRQMGKSSLMIRTAERLTAEGALPGDRRSHRVRRSDVGRAVVQGLPHRRPGSTVAEDAGVGLVGRPRRTTRSATGSPATSARSRWSSGSERLVIFVDEIDTTLRLDFTDDFFTAIRFLYQHRAADPELAAAVLRADRRRHARRSDQGRGADAVQHRPPDRAHRLHARRSPGAHRRTWRCPTPLGPGSRRLDPAVDRRPSVPHAAHDPIAGRIAAAGVDGRGR